jgi:hypothetical protein
VTKNLNSLSCKERRQFSFFKVQIPLQNPLSTPNVADVAAITLTRDLAAKSPERADMFNTRKFAGNICPSSRSGRRSDERDARQKRAKTRHF